MEKWTKGPGDQRTRGAKEQGTKEQGKQRTRGPKKTKGQITRAKGPRPAATATATL